MAALSRFPEYAKKNGYKTPNSISDGSYQLAYNTELNFFQWLQANGHGMQFAHHMGGYRSVVYRVLYPEAILILLDKGDRHGWSKQSPSSYSAVWFGLGCLDIVHGRWKFIIRLPHSLVTRS